MTEEEKAAHLAEREARAAARKRERDRLAREAALAAAETVEAQKAPAEAPAQVEVPTVEAGPVFEEVTVPETFGFAEPPLVETDPAAFVQAPVSAEGPVVKTEPTPGESQEIPVFAPGAEADQAPEEESAKTQWDTLKDLETLSQDADGSAPAIPVMPQAEHTEVQVGEAVPAAPVQETKAPAGEETAAPQEEVPAEKPVETEEDLDALLSEIRDLLAPCAQAGPGTAEKAAAACAGSFHSGRGSGSPGGGARSGCCPGQCPRGESCPGGARAGDPGGGGADHSHGGDSRSGDRAGRRPGAGGAGACVGF